MYHKVLGLGTGLTIFGLSASITALTYTGLGMAGWMIIRLLALSSSIRP